MSTELMPLIQHRPLTITVAAHSGRVAHPKHCRGAPRLALLGRGFGIQHPREKIPGLLSNATATRTQPGQKGKQKIPHSPGRANGHAGAAPTHRLVLPCRRDSAPLASQAAPPCRGPSTPRHRRPPRGGPSHDCCRVPGYPAQRRLRA
jgi:hypothetical protein